MTTCTRCQNTGFLNIEQVDEKTCALFDEEGHEVILKWIKDNENHDVQVCDCCGDGEGWYGEPGVHYKGEERDGVYDYNGGLCECH